MILLDDGISSITCEIRDYGDRNFCTEEACQAFYEKELTEEKCNILRYYPALTEEQQWSLAIIGAALAIILSYTSLVCLPVLFSPSYGIFRVFLSSFTLSLLIAVSIFELLPGNDRKIRRNLSKIFKKFKIKSKLQLGWMIVRLRYGHTGLSMHRSCTHRFGSIILWIDGSQFLDGRSEEAMGMKIGK